jgi:hypothetical protein
MKFDPDLARQILIDLEEAPFLPAYSDIELEGYSVEQISYHIMLLAKEGYVDAKDASTFGGSKWKVKALTLSGHKFLDQIRNDTFWAKVKSTAKTQGLQLTLSSIKAIVAHYIKQKTGIGG